eukprot:s2142_g19.t1
MQCSSSLPPLLLEGGVDRAVVALGETAGKRSIMELPGTQLAAGDFVCCRWVCLRGDTGNHGFDQNLDDSDDMITLWMTISQVNVDGFNLCSP